MPQFKLIFFAPVASTQSMLHQLFATSPHTVGKIGLYKSCAFVSRGTGQFVPGQGMSNTVTVFSGPKGRRPSIQAGSSPHIGAVGKPEFVEEDKVEVLVTDSDGGNDIKKAVEHLKKVHPYEEVPYEVYRMEDI